MPSASLLESGEKGGDCTCWLAAVMACQPAGRFRVYSSLEHFGFIVAPQNLFLRQEDINRALTAAAKALLERL